MELARAHARDLNLSSVYLSLHLTLQLAFIETSTHCLQRRGPNWCDLQHLVR